MKKLTKELIEKGLKPRFQWVGFTNPDQIKQKLEEFLPYCNISQELIKDALHVTIDFNDFKIKIKFAFRTTDEINFIQTITSEENE